MTGCDIRETISNTGASSLGKVGTDTKTVWVVDTRGLCNIHHFETERERESVKESVFTYLYSVFQIVYKYFALAMPVKHTTLELKWREREEVET